MKDIEELKKRQEKELQFAIRENQLCEKVGDKVDIRVIGNSIVHKGYLHVHCYNVKDIRMVGLVMTAFPVTEKKVVKTSKQEAELSYRIRCHGGPRTNGTEIEFAWISDDLDISVAYKLEENDEDFMQFFKKTTRKLTDIELLSYNINKTRWNVTYREQFPFYTFSCGNIIRHEGGYHLQISEGHACSIVETIKYKYQFREDEDK